MISIINKLVRTIENILNNFRIIKEETNNTSIPFETIDQVKICEWNGSPFYKLLNGK